MAGLRSLSRCFICVVLVLRVGTVEAGAGEIVNNAPAQPIRRVVLEELWRVGADDALVLGAPVGVVLDSLGRIVVCDHQLASLLVLDTVAGTAEVLARSGQGPGELGYPVAVANWADGGFGVAEFFPGRIVRISAGGAPAGTIDIDPTPDQEGGFTLLTDLCTGGGQVVVTGFYQTPRADGLLRNDFLAAIDDEGLLRIRYLDRHTVLAPEAPVVRERDYLGRLHLTHAVAPDGRVLVASDPERYRLDVFRPDGSQDRSIVRRFATRPRSAKEIRMIEALFEAWNSGRPDPPVVEVDRDAPAVEDIQVDAHGRIWVRHADSGRSEESEVFLVLDRFDPAGHWEREVAFVCPGDRDLDGLVILDDRRVLVMRHDRLSRLIRFAAIAGRSPTFGLAGENRPLELICYEVPGGLMD